jgi:hypothetical protein
MSASGQEAEQNRKRDKRAAGSAMGFLNVCLAFVTFFRNPILLTFKILLCANKRVINRLQIPSSSNRFAIILVGFGSARSKYAAPSPKLRLRHFTTSCEIPTLRMTLGV